MNVPKSEPVAGARPDQVSPYDVPPDVIRPHSGILLLVEEAGVRTDLAIRTIADADKGLATDHGRLGVDVIGTHERHDPINFCNLECGWRFHAEDSGDGSGAAGGAGARFEGGKSAFAGPGGARLDVRTAAASRL